MEFSLALIEWLSLIVVMAGTLALVTHFFGRTPQYGKHSQDAKFTLNARLAWALQECPSCLVPAYIVYAVGPGNIAAPHLIITLLFTAHYFQRTFIYPMLMNKQSKPVPVSIMIFGFTFTSVNGFAIAGHQSKYGSLDGEWMHSTQFVVGILMWILGMGINLHSDHILRNLRKEGDSGYKIPRGGFFNYVSGANYFGEIVEWCGLAVASNFGLPLSCFALSTMFVIGTRAIAHHKFYLQKFEDYPPNRKAVIPFLL